MKLKGVEDSIQTWVKLNGCDEKPKTDTISKDGDEMKVTRRLRRRQGRVRGRADRH